MRLILRQTCCNNKNFGTIFNSKFLHLCHSTYDLHVYITSKTTTLAGAPSIPLRNSGKQTRNILLPIHFFKFELRASMIPIFLDKSVLCIKPSWKLYFSTLTESIPIHLIL